VSYRSVLYRVGTGVPANERNPSGSTVPGNERPAFLRQSGRDARSQSGRDARALQFLGRISGGTAGGSSTARRRRNVLIDFCKTPPEVLALAARRLPYTADVTRSRVVAAGRAASATLRSPAATKAVGAAMTSRVALTVRRTVASGARPSLAPTRPTRAAVFLGEHFLSSVSGFQGLATEGRRPVINSR